MTKKTEEDKAGWAEEATEWARSQDTGQRIHIDNEGYASYQYTIKEIKCALKKQGYAPNKKAIDLLRSLTIVFHHELDNYIKILGACGQLKKSKLLETMKNI